MSASSIFKEEQRYETINGKIVMMSSASVHHNIILGNLYSIFNHYLRGKNCKAIIDVNLFISKDNTFRPDLMVVCNKSFIKPTSIIGPPAIVVEILSPSTEKTDKICKMKLYQEFNINEYWLINPFSKSIEIYILENDIYVLHEIYNFYPEDYTEFMTDEEKSKIIYEFSQYSFQDLTISIQDIFYNTD